MTSAKSVLRRIASMVALLVACFMIFCFDSACHQPTQGPGGEQDQIDSAIDTISGFKQFEQCAKDLAAKRKAGTIVVNSLKKNHGETNSDKTPDPMPDIIHVNSETTIGAAADFDCNEAFIELMATLVHEYFHAVGVEIVGSTRLEFKLNALGDHKRVYMHEIDFLVLLENELQIIHDTGKASDPHFARFEHCTKAQLDFLIVKAKAIHAVDQRVVQRIDNLLRNPDLDRDGVRDDRDAALINKKKKYKRLLSGYKMEALADSSDSLLVVDMRTGERADIPTGIPITLDGEFVNGGRGLLVCGITDLLSPSGVVRLLVDPDRSGHFQNSSTIVPSGSFLTVPYNFAHGPDGTLYVYDNDTAHLHRVQFGADGYPALVEPFSTVHADPSVLDANEANSFDWMDGVPAGYHYSVAGVERNTRVALFEELNGVLTYTNAIPQLQTDYRAPYPVHPLFDGLRAIECFGAPGHQVVIEEDPPAHSRAGPRILGQGLIGSNNRASIALSQPIDGGHRYTFHDTSFGWRWHLQPTVSSPFITHMSTYEVPLSGGTLTGTGYYLDRVTSVRIGGEPAPITAQSSTSIQFVAAPRTLPGFYSISLYVGPTLTASPGCLQYTVPQTSPIITLTTPTPEQSILPTSNTILTTTVTQNGTPIPGASIVLSDALTGNPIDTIATDEAGIARFRVAVGQSQLTMIVFIDSPPYTRRFDPGKPRSCITLYGR